MTDPGAVLAPLRERYAQWLHLLPEAVVEAREEDPAEVRAIQLVLRLERPRPDVEPPSLHTALALAATGCAALCLDERAAPGGEWHDAVADYCRGHIRKVTRRARGAQWEATADLPGLTLSDGATELRVLLPGRIAELDHRVGKLQVGGTDLPVDAPRPAVPGALRITVPTDPPMTAGKQLAQTGHAGMIAAALLAGDDPAALERWRAAGCPTHVVRQGGDAWQQLLSLLDDPAEAWRSRRALAVRDAGFTEIPPGTVTAVAAFDGS